MHAGMHLLVYLVHSGMHSCTIAPGVLHKCSMAHITLIDMHFSQLGAIAQLEKELVCLLRWPEQQASSKSWIKLGQLFKNGLHARRKVGKVQLPTPCHH